MKLKIIKKILLAVLIIQVNTILAVPRISQVDNSGFALKNEISIFVNVDNKRNLNKENFKVYEKVQNKDKVEWKQRKITGFKKPDDLGKGINFVLLLDVSGSMAGRKIKSARDAIVSFIQSVGEHDSVKIITFGKTVKQTKSFTKNKNVLIKSVLSIPSPSANAPTPMYYAADTALKSLKNKNGRKVIILLSDGLNDLRKDGYNDLSGFDKIPGTTLENTIKTANKTGIPVYSIGFECNTNEMRIISYKSGGKYFAYTKAEDLKNIYNEIRLNVLSEYMISYKTDIGGFDIRQAYVTVDKVKSNERDYYAGSILGVEYPVNILTFLALVIALLLLLLLYSINFVAKRKISEIKILKGKASTGKLGLTDKPVVIGRHERSNMGLFGDKTIANHHAKIEKNNSKYIIEQLDENYPVYVDKKSIHKAVLRDGNIIQIGDALLVFNKKDEVV